MTRMAILGVTHRDEDGRAMVCLEAVDRPLRLALLVPMNEANRLGRSLGLGPCPCVPVFELIETLLAHFRAPLLRAVLDGGDGGISGAVYVRAGEREDGFPCHPSDALALATRAGVPIYAAEGALRYACPIAGPPSPDPTAWRRWLEGVTPEDFRRLG